MEALGLGIGPDRNEGTLSPPDGKCRQILSHVCDILLIYE